MTDTERFRIGQVAKKSGFSIHTIRYYEKLGLLKNGARTHGGFREYSATVFTRLSFIKNAKKLGLTLEEINVIFQKCERLGTKHCAGHLSGLLKKKIKQLNRNIGEYEERKKSLHRFMNLLAEDPAKIGLNW